MRIQSIKTFNLNFTFSGHEDFLDNLEGDNLVHSFVQYDDPEALVRNKIRAHMYEHMMPVNNYEHNEINSYASNLEETNITNLQKLFPRCYRGASFVKYLSHFNLLKKSGVETIIDLVGYDALSRACRRNGINYYPFVVEPDFWGNPIFKTDSDLLNKKTEEWNRQGLKVSEYNTQREKFQEDIKLQRDKFIVEFKKLIDVINEKSFYICCDQGEYRTPNILALNTLFNPKWMGKETYPTGTYMIKIFENMYQNLTSQHKKILGIDKEYELALKEHFKKIKSLF